MDKGDLLIYGILAMFLIVCVVLMGALVVNAVNNPSTAPYETDHKILATEISRLHDDVRILQTQIAGKQ